MPPKDDPNDAADDDFEDAASEKTAFKSGQKLVEFKALRASTKGSISRMKSLITKKGNNLSPEELECRLGILESYFKQCLSVQANIDKICPEADTTANAAMAGEVEDLYVSTKSKILALMPKRRTSVAEGSILNTTTAVTATSRLRREIKIPKFEGKYSEFPKFISIFNKMVHQDETLENCERFLILKDSLGPKPLSAIADFDVTENNYPKALDRLKENFDKKTLMFEEHISALFEIQKYNKGCSEHLRHVIDSVNAHLSAMLSIGDYKDIANALIIFLIMGKLDSESQVKWEESVDYSKLSSWEDCSTVLSRRCQNLEAREARSSRLEVKPAVSKGSHRELKNNSQTSLAIGKAFCDICRKPGHALTNCSEFAKMSVRERYNTARNSKVCFVCLKKGHSFKLCTAMKCPICNLAHHKMLHRFVVSDSAILQQNVAAADELPPSQQVALHTTLVDKVELPEVFLETAVVYVKDACNRYHTARVILDSASQINLMCEKMAQKLMLKKTSCALGANGVADICTNIKKKTQTTIKSRVNEFEVTLEFYILPKITGAKPDQFVNVAKWQIPKNIELADPLFNYPARVDLLLGAEIFLDLISIGRIKLSDNLPRLQKTLLGWVVSGAAKNCDSQKSHVQSLLVHSEHVPETEQLNNLVEKFWEMEQITTKETFWTEEDKECERIFQENVDRDAAGRFIVKIPFKKNLSELGDSYRIAERRFLALERRLSRDPTTKKAYINFMDEYQQLGHMSMVENTDMDKIKYFSPHQYVLRPESTSTKLRVVFDCSCKTSSGLSLNEVMMKGPVVQDDLLSIVLRFRCFKFALTADVAKMYRQAWVTKEDSNYQAVLWRSSNEEVLKAYRLLTITYGTTSAPYLATRCLKKLGEENAEKFPLGSKKLLNDFYMDDFISGADTEEEIFQLYQEVSSITSSAHFILRKWYSNNEHFLSQVPEKDREKPLRVNESEIIKTLGIVWEPTADVLRYVRPELVSSKNITKRTVLAELSTLFDPLGLINPVIVKAKIFMQDLWILKVDWDESLSMNLQSHWEEIRRKLRMVAEIRVSRYVLTAKKRIRVEMHGFSDASVRAYGCCIYVRCIDCHNGVSIQLWSAKSRVAPVKTKSLPRLELLAAELLSKLLVKTQSNFSVPVEATYLWTDSEIVLNWLSVHPSAWSTFVANRVASIQESTKTAFWRHVPSKMNPADIVSRGAFADELQKSFWFSGPDFLKKPGDEWPLNKARKNVCDVNEERRTTTLIIEQEKNDFVKWIESHSQYEMIRRRVATLLCVFRRRNVGSGITASLLDEALIRIIYCLQRHCFSVEFRALMRKEEVPATSKLKGLNLFIESSHGVDLIRVGGRLVHANLPYDTKHQILLPNNSNFVRCYVRYMHDKNLHAGTQALMAITRQRFWIIHARKLIRSVIGKCMQCFRCRPKLEQQIMGNLPANRVNITRPFTTTGVDFCGPVMTTYKQRGMRLIKSYIAVFICFVTKAVHLEVVSDLTSKSFIAALKRFVARRGLCAHLYCDNGTNFVGARRELRELKEMFFEQQMQQKISQYCTANSIEFHHIPPRSPHFGGLWEAAVKAAKYHLTRILGTAYLTFEELSTVTAEIEAVLNSRPLTAMSNDPNDEAVLTPAHFLMGGPLVGIAEPSLETENMSHMNRWLRISAIQQHFWKRWLAEYLHELQSRAKWTRKRRNIEKDDLVLVADDNLPPKQWLLGRVTHVVNGAEGCVRVVNIRTKTGEIRRAVHKVAPIPKADSDC